MLDTACCIQEYVSGNASYVVCMRFNKRNESAGYSSIIGSGNVLHCMPH